jgi:drug/metabolite transporter (DMT)-like permease
MRDTLIHYQAQLLTLLASALWGTSFVAVKFGLEDLDAYWFLQWRLTVAAILLLLLFGRRPEVWSYLRRPRIWNLGILMTGAYVFQFVGMQYTTASAAAFLVNFGIVFVALLSYIALGETFGRRKVIGLVVAILGVYLLTTGGVWVWSWQDLRGDVLVLLSGLFWAGFTVVNKTVVTESETTAIPVTTAVVFLSTWMVLPFAFLLCQLPARLEWHQAGVIAYLAFFCTVLPFLFWLAGLRHLTPTVSAAVLLAEPVFASLFAFLLLRETMALSQWFGAALILVAIGLVSIEPSAKRPVPVSEALTVE